LKYTALIFGKRLKGRDMKTEPEAHKSFPLLRRTVIPKNTQTTRIANTSGAGNSAKLGQKAEKMRFSTQSEERAFLYICIFL
jgi:hypothetical protein